MAASRPSWKFLNKFSSQTDLAISRWEAVEQHRDSDLLKLFCSDIQAGHLENLQTTSASEPKVGLSPFHQGIQLILAYSWARPAVLAADKGREGMLLFLLLLHFLSFPSFFPLSFISSTISSTFFLPFSGRRHKMTHKGWRVVKPQHNQSDSAQTWWEAFGWHGDLDCKVCFVSVSKMAALVCHLENLQTVMRI